jgi:hypothetical protein
MFSNFLAVGALNIPRQKKVPVSAATGLVGRRMASAPTKNTEFKRTDQLGAYALGSRAAGSRFVGSRSVGARFAGSRNLGVLKQGAYLLGS